MYRVHFTNFNYYSANESETLEEAKKIAKYADFKATIEYNGEIVASFCPDRGWVSYVEQKTA